MKDKRKTKRKYLLYYMRVFDIDSQSPLPLGNLVDITPKGAMLVSEKPLPVDVIFHLRLEVTDDVAEKPFIEFGAKSLWCKPDVDPHFYNTGFKILDLSSEDAKIVQRIVDVYGFRDN